MSSSFSVTESIPYSGTLEDVPSKCDRWSYSGRRLYEKNSPDASSIVVPSVYEVPYSIDYEGTTSVTVQVDGNPFDRSISRCVDSVDGLKDNVNGLTECVNGINKGVAELSGEVESSS